MISGLHALFIRIEIVRIEELDAYIINAQCIHVAKLTMEINTLIILKYLTQLIRSNSKLLLLLHPVDLQ